MLLSPLEKLLQPIAANAAMVRMCGKNSVVHKKKKKVGHKVPVQEDFTLINLLSRSHSRNGRAVTQKVIKIYSNAPVSNIHQGHKINLLSGEKEMTGMEMIKQAFITGP